MNSGKLAADILYSYLHDIIYRPSNASLDISRLPQEFTVFGRSLEAFGKMITEARDLAKELAAGNLNCRLPPPSNEIASPLKMLHASLKHLSWQTQQVAKGDYSQKVSFMGAFSDAFNNMTEQLAQKQKTILNEKSMMETYMHRTLANCPYPILLFGSNEKLIYVSDSFSRFGKYYSRDEIQGRNMYEFFGPLVSEKGLKEIKQLYREAIAGGESPADGMPAGRDDLLFETEQELDFGVHEKKAQGIPVLGSGCRFKIRMMPILDNDKKTAGIMMFFDDLTENIAE